MADNDLFRNYVKIRPITDDTVVSVVRRYNSETLEADLFFCIFGFLFF